MPPRFTATVPRYLQGIIAVLAILAQSNSARSALIDGSTLQPALPEQGFTADQANNSVTNPSFTFTGVPVYGTLTVSYGPYFNGQTAADPTAPPTSVSGTPTNPLALALDQPVQAPPGDTADNDPNFGDYPYSWKTVVQTDNAAGNTFVLGGVPGELGGQDIGVTNGFGGPIAILFSVPVASVELTAGSFDFLGLTQIEGFTASGMSIGSVVNTVTGFETFYLADSTPGELISGLLLTTTDPGGFGVSGVGLLESSSGPVPMPAPGGWAILPGLAAAACLQRRRPRQLLCLGAGILFSAAPPAAAQTFDCVVEPEMTLKVGSPIATTLASVEVTRGDIVTKGQVLARLASGVEIADLALAEARARSTAEIDSRRSKLEFAQGDLNRGTRLLDNANIAPQKVDELRTNFRVAQQDLATAELNHQLAILDLARAQALLNARIIRSPVDGVVTQRSLGPGEFVAQDSNIVVIAVISPLHVQAYPPVNMFTSVKVGQLARVALTEPPDTILDASVTVVDRVFDAASGTVGVQLTLPNESGTVPAGQRCRVVFDGSVLTSSARLQR